MVSNSVPVKTKSGDPRELSRSLALDGELVPSPGVSTESEAVVAKALRDEGIDCIPHHHVGGHEFDFKIKGYQVLVEVDGKIHDMYSKRLKDLRKDRVALKRGFRVLRFSSDESPSVVVADVKSVIGSLPKVPREVWLVKYTLFMRIRDWVKGW